MAEKKIRLGTLGSAATFAGEATIHMRESYPEYGEPVYYPSMEDCWEELKKGSVDAVILGVERTGQPHHGDTLISHGFYVIGESSQPLICNLYVKPGTRKGDIRKITGHGSIHQCSAYLDREFPGVPRVRHELNSVEAAREVMTGDGTVAVVGSRSLARVVPGLEEMAGEINDDATCSWCAISTHPIFSDEPEVVMAASRFGPDGSLGTFIREMDAIGYSLRTAASFPVNAGISTYDYFLTFGGKGRRSAVESVVSRFEGARLVGAFDRRG